MTGPLGLTGPQGLTGPPGAPGVSGLTEVSAEAPADAAPANSTSFKQAVAVCPPGNRAIGSGGGIEGGTSGGLPNQVTDVVIRDINISAPDQVPGFVIVRGVEEDATAADWKVRAEAICADVS